MGQARLKHLRHERIRKGEFTCVYCGIEPSSEVDHMPPRALFRNKRRPNDLFFPSCQACNRGTSSLDSIVSWLGRIHPDSTYVQEREEVKALGRAIIENFPEVASAFYRDTRPMTETDFERLGTSLVTPLNCDDPYVHRAIQYFGAKVGFALHWLQTGEPLSPSGRVYARWMTNAQAIRGMLPPNLFAMFPEPAPLRQGTQQADGFWYSSQRAGEFTTHLAIFGKSFITVSLVAPFPDQSLRDSDIFEECAPGCFKQGYPFGLAPLTEIEIARRFERLRRS